MKELLEQVVAALPAIWRRRWIGLVVATLVCTVGWFAVTFVQDKYVSQTRVYVDAQQLLKPLLSRLTVDINRARELQILQQTLVSTPNLERVLRITNMDAEVTGDRQMQSLISEVRSRINVQSGRNNLFRISYESDDPVNARDVVQALLDIFMESNLGSSRREMDSAQRFLEDETRRYEALLNKKEEEIARFRQDNVQFLGGGGQYYQRVENARAQIAAIKGTFDEVTSRAEELEKQLATVPEFFETDANTVDSGGPSSGTEERILQMESRLDQLLLTYTERHPDVQAVRRRLAGLRAELEAEMNANPDDSEGDSSGSNKIKAPNPVYESIKTRLIELQGESAALQTKLTTAQAGLEKLEELADKIPEVETELSRLVRDHGIMKSNYAELRSSQEKAAISESRDTEVEKVQFRIIEPPQVPKIPVGVKRSALVTTVLGVAAAAGLGICIVFVLFQKTFYSPRTLADITGLRVLGTVGQSSGGDASVMRLARHVPFLAAAAILVGTYGSLMIYERNVGLNNLVPEQTRAQMLERMPAFLQDRLK
ncbi:MAG: XrtA system polysaccharide chain length determinant [Magnetospiraceae bacterium]